MGTSPCSKSSDTPTKGEDLSTGTSACSKSSGSWGNPFRLPGLGTDSEPREDSCIPILATHSWPSTLGRRLKLGGVPWWPNGEDSMLSLP